MTLTIRARLTLWYAVLMFVVLVGAGTGVLWLHGRVGLARLDGELEEAAVVASGALRSEFDEGLLLPQGAIDLVEGIELPGVGIAVLSSRHEVIASRPTQGPTVAGTAGDAAILAATTLPGDVVGFRVRGIDGSHNEQTYRIVVWTPLARLSRERVTLQRALFLGIPLAVLLAGLGGWSLGRRALRPVVDMARQAESIGAHLRDARLVVPNPHDELGTLARAFNGLLERLAASFQAQRAFMADASHQLRTPVSVVRIAAQVALGRDERPNIEYRESLDVIARQAERLTKMVDDMFVLALADADARPLQLTPLYLDEVIAQVVGEARVLAAERSLTLRTDLPEEVSLFGDEHLLRQLLMNLLDNAMRYTPPGGTIVVTLVQTSSGVRLVVRDTGTGIPHEEVARIFERFVRLGAQGAGAGAGLGLPIARWIAEAHGGSLVLESTGPTGSAFVTTLPVGTAPALHS